MAAMDKDASIDYFIRYLIAAPKRMMNEPPIAWRLGRVMPAMDKDALPNLLEDKLLRL